MLSNQNSTHSKKTTHGQKQDYRSENIQSKQDGYLKLKKIVITILYGIKQDWSLKDMNKNKESTSMKHLHLLLKFNLYDC
jgi:hypothetical protein